MKLFEYNDKDLELFFALGSWIVDLKNKTVERVNFSVFETSSGPEDLDFPFDAQKVTIRPGFWYALNLAIGGEKKKQIVEAAKQIRGLAAEKGDYEISFVIVLPPNSTIPDHRHFREYNSLTYCIPASPPQGCLEIIIGDEPVQIKKGFIYFDSKVNHSAINRSNTTYWIFVFENVIAADKPRLEVVEL